MKRYATAVLAVALLRCSSSTDAPGPGAGGAAAHASSAMASGPSAVMSSTSAGGSGGSGGAGGFAEYIPTPADIAFVPGEPVPAGEQILFNDWNDPNALRSMKPDGSGTLTVFTVFRLWNFGVSRHGDALAFACGDPKQQDHFGLTLGDAIQHSWRYDFASQKIELLAHGNINDECYAFDAADAFLYLCRRYDFKPDNSFSGYRVGRIALGDKSFEFLTPDAAGAYALNPQPAADGKSFLFTRIVNATQATIRKMPLPPAQDALVVDKARSPVISPDGTKLLYNDDSQKGVLRVANLDGSNGVAVSEVRGTSAQFSPDGKKIVYLRDDGVKPCQHVEVVAADGSQATAPVRIRDCGKTGEFITDLAWFVRK